jgi:hypothetical protein
MEEKGGGRRKKRSLSCSRLNQPGAIKIVCYPSIFMHCFCCSPLLQDWAFLQKYSPYHNIDPECAGKNQYPALLMTTSTRDDRVHPYHARCFVKRLLDCRNAYLSDPTQHSPAVTISLNAAIADSLTLTGTLTGAVDTINFTVDAKRGSTAQVEIRVAPDGTAATTATTTGHYAGTSVLKSPPVAAAAATSVPPAVSDRRWGFGDSRQASPVHSHQHHSSSSSPVGVSSSSSSCWGDKVLYFENIEGGHGGAADNKQQAYMSVMYLEFLRKVLFEVPGHPN